MFGKNPIRKPTNGDGTSLDIVEIFPTIQGEGPHAGTPAIFLRLGGCNLACDFCDTEFEDFKNMPLDDILHDVMTLVESAPYKLIVITGGEPLRQPIEHLCAIFLDNGFNVQIESNGTLYRDLPERTEIVCSPKISNGKYHPIRDDLKPYIIAYKFIISASDEDYNTLAHWNDASIYLQPMDEYDEAKNSANTALAVELCQKYGYILSLQQHKVLGLR